MNCANVDANGNLQTKVNGGLVGVVGSVTATQTPPSLAFADGTGFNLMANAGNCVDVATPPTGKALVVTSIKIAVNGLSVTPTPMYIVRNPTCNANGPFADLTTWNGTGTFVTPYPSGLPVPYGQSLWMYVSPGGTTEGTITVNGYLVPASACQTPLVCVH